MPGARALHGEKTLNTVVNTKLHELLRNTHL
jgi:hypothetical protein